MLQNEPYSYSKSSNWSIIISRKNFENTHPSCFHKPSEFMSSQYQPGKYEGLLKFSVNLMYKVPPFFLLAQH